MKSPFTFLLNKAPIPSLQPKALQDPRPPFFPALLSPLRTTLALLQATPSEDSPTPRTTGCPSGGCPPSECTISSHAALTRALWSLCLLLVTYSRRGCLFPSPRSTYYVPGTRQMLLQPLFLFRFVFLYFRSQSLWAQGQGLRDITSNGSVFEAQTV